MKHVGVAAVLIIITGIAYPSTTFANVVKRTNKATGAISYSSTGCPSGNDLQPIKVRPVNTIEGAAQEKFEQQELSGGVDNVQARPRSVLIRHDSGEKNRKQKLCGTIEPGLRGYTAKQLQILSQCANLNVDSNDSGPVSAPAPLSLRPR